MKIYLLCGMIASGKSTYCKHAAKEGSIIVNDDSIVNCVHADNYLLYNPKLKTLYKSTENHLVNMAIALQRTAIVDRGLNVSVRARKRWIAMADSLDVPCEAIVFPRDSNELHAKRRFENDSRGLSYDVWLNIARRHSADYAVPTVEEGLDAVHYITWDEIQKGKVIV